MQAGERFFCKPGVPLTSPPSKQPLAGSVRCVFVYTHSQRKCPTERIGFSTVTQRRKITAKKMVCELGFGKNECQPGEALRAAGFPLHRRKIQYITIKSPPQY